jgi:hypothetical protein
MNQFMMFIFVGTEFENMGSNIQTNKRLVQKLKKNDRSKN